MSERGYTQRPTATRTPVPATMAWPRPLPSAFTAAPVETEAQPDLQTQLATAQHMQVNWSQMRIGGTPSVVQPKLKVGAPGDQYEQEADRVAAQVMRMEVPAVQREPESEEEEVRAKPIAEMGMPLVQREKQPEAEPEEVQAKPMAEMVSLLVQREEQPDAEDEAVRAKPIAEMVTPLVQREPEAGEDDPIRAKADGLLQREVATEDEDAVQPLSIQREEVPEEEASPLRMKPEVVQRQTDAEDEEPVQAKANGLLQREAVEDEDAVQMQPLLMQREELPGEENPVQAKLIQREEVSDDEDATVQRRSIATVQGKANSSDLESQLNSSKGGGSPLSDDVRSFMEPRFGADLSQVRVHTGSDAVQMNKDLNAQAFTHKQDIFFGAGKSPGKNDLTAHELTHVVQQTGAVQAKGQDSDSKQIESPKTGADFKGGGGESGGGGSSDSYDAPTKPRASSDSSAAADKSQGSVTPASDKGVQEGKTPHQSQEDKSATNEKQEPQPIAADLATVDTGNLALVDEELAEHQRWAGALNRVGAESSTERAAFIAEQVGSGFLNSAGESSLMGAGIGVASRVGMRLAEKGATAIAAKAATKFGTQAAKFTPLPAIGAVIGGAMSAYALYERDWKSTKATISHFGEGSSIYEKLANSIAAVSEIIDVYTNVLNVIAGVVGAISAAMWIITVASAGLASPLAATLSSIALGIGTASMILDAVNAMILQPCILLFRSLHTFTSQADPREVESQGGALAKSAGVMGGALGAFAGGKAAHVGGNAKPPAEAPETKVHSEHPIPAPAAGEDTVIQFEKPQPLSEKPGVLIPSEPSTSTLNNEASFASLNPEVEKLNNSNFAESLDWHPPTAKTAPVGTNFNNAHSKGAADFRANNPMPEGTQAQHWTKKIESEAANLHPDSMNENMSALQSERPSKRGTEGDSKPAETLLTDPAGGGTTYSLDGELQTGDNIRRPRRKGDRAFGRKDQGLVYQTEHKFADNYLIPAEASRIPEGSDPGNTALWSGANARWTMTGEAGTDKWRTTGEWGPQPPPFGQSTSSGSSDSPSMTKPKSDIPKALRPEVPLSPTRQLGEEAFGSHDQSSTNKSGEENQSTVGIERVNPNYPSPPGTPQQIVDFQNEAEHLLSSRAQAEKAEAQMAAEEQKHQANQAPLQQAQQKTEGAMSATQAHQQAVTQRQQANQEQQQRQQQSQGLVAGYPSRVAGLTVLTIPLKGFERFTAIGSLLPDSAGNVKQNLLKMNNDAKRFLGALAQMDGKMAEQNNAQPARQQELQGDHSRLQTTDQQAGNSQQDFQKAHEGTQALQESNTQKLNQAIEAKSEAATQKEELSTAAEQKQQQAQTLSEQMQSWAQTHQAARQIAIAETQKRLQEKGFVIRGVQEK
jgi:hypothetical protein